MTGCIDVSIMWLVVVLHQWVWGIILQWGSTLNGHQFLLSHPDTNKSLMQGPNYFLKLPVYSLFLLIFVHTPPASPLPLSPPPSSSNTQQCIASYRESLLFWEYMTNFGGKKKKKEKKNKIEGKWNAMVTEFKPQLKHRTNTENLGCWCVWTLLCIMWVCVWGGGWWGRSGVPLGNSSAN